MNEILKQRKFFKLICGAGNENFVEIRRLSTIYTIAGATTIDVSANIESIKSAIEGISIGNRILTKLNLQHNFPSVMISINASDDDPHFRKAVINLNTCDRCGNCVKMCDQNAIHLNISDNFSILFNKCIGCGKCATNCKSIYFTHKNSVLWKNISKCIRAGADSIELHSSTQDDDIVISKWKLISSIALTQQMSLCLDRSKLSDEKIIKRINDAYEIVGDRMIIQADGIIMSGDEDDYNTTLQSIAIADIILKKIHPYINIIASGGTNSKTRELADLCGVNINGVAIGTYARKIVKSYINNNNFDRDDSIIIEAADIAKNLVNRSIGVY